MRIQNISNNKREVTIFCREADGSLKLIKDNTYFPYYYEVDALKGTHKTFDNKLVRKIICSVPGDVAKQRTSNSYEADILFAKRYIIDKIAKFDKTVLKYFFIDIEVLATDLPDPLKAPDPISCITLYNSISKSIHTWYMGDSKYDQYKTELQKERALLFDFVTFVRQEKPDLLLAWNVEFDYPYLHQRYKDFAKAISPIGEARYGTVDDIMYPAGVSICDYMEMFKKIYMREQSYALDNVAQKYLDEAPWGKTAFNVLNDTMRAKNINDIKRMMKLEEKLKILDYYDEIRRFATCTWEDLTANSRILDMVVLREANKKGIILPTKKKKDENAEEVNLQGAYRRAEAGMYKNIYKADIISMYPSQMVNFCLDAQNISDQTDKEAINIDGLWIKQDSSTLIPTITKDLMKLKDDLKRQVKEETDEEQKKTLQNKYAAIKGLVNSLYGIIGFRGFRLFNNDIASRITFLARDLLQYVENKMKDFGYEVIYTDTDALMYKSEQDEISLLNKLVQDWAIERYNKPDVSLTFESEGKFKKLLILTKCRYYGIYDNDKIEIKGMEMKRSSSSKYESIFQKDLVNLILDGKTKEEVRAWVDSKISTIKSEPLNSLCFPAKISNKEYKNVPIFLRAYRNTQKYASTFKLNKGELFHYVFVKDYGKDENKKEINALVVTEEVKDLKDHLDWSEIIRRNILMKTDAIFEALYKESYSMRDGAVVAQLAHNQTVEGAIPSPAKKRGRSKKIDGVVPLIKEQSAPPAVEQTGYAEPSITKDIIKEFDDSQEILIEPKKAIACYAPVTINHSFKTNSKITERTIKVAEAFGLGIDEEKEFNLYNNVELRYKSNDIVYITGDSGSGKSWILKNHFTNLDNTINIDEVKIKDDVPIIEQVGSNLSKALECLNIAGLGDAFLYLRNYNQLSDGQKYRFRIAKLLDMQDKDVWIIDEFCATLDRTTAKIISYNLNKIVKKLNKMLVVATTHNDLKESLKPNVYIQKGYESDIDISYWKDIDYDKSCELLKDMKFELGSKEDYEKLKRFHYRQAALGGVKTFYKCSYKNDLIGVIVICYPHLALKGRNIALNDRFAKMSKESCSELNQVVESISRVVIHPKYRGIGLAQFMLKNYFKKTNIEYVETLAVMANYNPFFEKAGMTRIDVEEDIQRLNKIKELEKYGFNIELLSSKRYTEDHFNTLDATKQNEIKDIVKKILSRYKGQIVKLFSNKSTVEEVVNNRLFEAIKELPRANTVYLYKKIK